MIFELRTEISSVERRFMGLPDLVKSAAAKEDDSGSNVELL
jgi:hypothetical protein